MASTPVVSTTVVADLLDEPRPHLHQPLLATAEKAEAICRAVTAMPCPMGMLPMEDPDHWSTGATMPPDSTGNSMPVGLPNP